ncbi:hypothetical protein HPP92_028308 [Vanilla planifolia]|uniref:Uncharacterized protein n=1 Tax=Vanilla planifolia TaxID=51239 RepID=A0A835U3Z5_VANPL|nr:hypothetical protein HPP92_028308 [Vanilla planifolia]
MERTAVTGAAGIGARCWAVDTAVAKHGGEDREANLVVYGGHGVGTEELVVKECRRRVDKGIEEAVGVLQVGYAEKEVENKGGPLGSLWFASRANRWICGDFSVLALRRCFVSSDCQFMTRLSATVGGQRVA